MSDTAPKIYAAMIAVMRDVDAIGKDKKNPQQGFMYRGIDDCYNALHNLMARHGVFTTSKILDTEREERLTTRGSAMFYTRLKIRFVFWTSDGSSLPTEVMGEAMDMADKACNKAMSIAHKYALLQAFMIPTEDMPDPDADAFELAARQPVKTTQGGNGKPAPAPRHQDRPISEAQKRRLEARIQEGGLDREEVKAWIYLHSQQKLSRTSELTTTLYNQLDERLDNWAALEELIRHYGVDRDRVLKWVQAGSKNQITHLADVTEALADKLADKIPQWAAKTEEVGA